MEIEIDTDTDSYEIWKKVEKLIEFSYQTGWIVHPLEPKPGGKASGTKKSRWNII